MTILASLKRVNHHRKGIATLLLLACLFSGAVVTTLASDVMTELRNLREAPRDNVQWSILQLQIEFQRLRLSAEQSLADSVDGTESLSQNFDIFYSRAQLLKTAPIFAPFRTTAHFRKAMDAIDAIIADLLQVFDLGPARVRQERSEIAARLARSEADIQSFVLNTIATFAIISDKERARLVVLLGTLGAAATGVLLTLLVALLALRLHTIRIERRTAELADSEERLAATVRSALDAVIVTDEVGTIVDFNEQASKCFGHTRESAIGANLADLIIPERMRAAHIAGMERYGRTNEATIIGKRTEIDALHADGHEFPIELALGVASLGQSRLFVAFARDITQRRSDEAALREAKEEAQEASKAKSRFLAVISHEMRTPLNGILGVIQLLYRTRLDSEQERLINVARLSGEMLLDQINDVLDLTKMQAGRLELDPNAFELSILPQTVREIMAFDATERGNAIHIDLDPRMPRWLIGDANRLRQILLNLVANANKFTRDGKITIASKVAKLDAAHVSIELSVTDTGIGIPKERIAQLFSEFGTLDNSFQRKFGGTGLGLVISRRLAELMGGTIEVESTFGQGSRFWLSVTLPIARNEQLPVRQSRDQPEASPERTCARILLAEDNQTNALIARALLTGAGHQVHIVGDGQDAVRAVSQREFDLVLLDISMPVMDGLEATRLIRALPEPQCRVPIVAMTAHAFAEDRKMILEAGINGYLAKPLRRETLLEAVSLYSSRSDNSEQPNETHADATPDIPLIDDREMSQFLSDVGPAIAPHLISQFSADVQKQVQIMIDASKRHDHAAVRKAAHALAGCSATIGASRLTATARAIEAAYNGPNADVSSGLFSMIATIQAETLRAITHHQQPGQNRNSMPARSAA